MKVVVSLFSLLLCLFHIGSVFGLEHALAVQDTENIEDENEEIHQNIDLKLNLDCKASELSPQELEYISRAFELSFDDANPGHQFSGTAHIDHTTDEGNALDTADVSNLRGLPYHWGIFNRLVMGLVIKNNSKNPCRWCVYQDDYFGPGVVLEGALEGRKSKKWLKTWAKRLCALLQQSSFKHLKTANKCKIFLQEEGMESTEGVPSFLSLGA